jgi:hypothetical protein
MGVERRVSVAESPRKRCTRCHRLRLRSAFSTKKDRRCGISAQCKECLRINSRVWHAAQAQRNRRVDPYANDSPKRCCLCRRRRPRTLFPIARSQKDGLASRCRDCVADRQATTLAQRARKRRKYHVSKLPWPILYAIETPGYPGIVKIGIAESTRRFAAYESYHPLGIKILAVKRIQNRRDEIRLHWRLRPFALVRKDRRCEWYRLSRAQRRMFTSDGWTSLESLLSSL